MKHLFKEVKSEGSKVELLMTITFLEFHLQGCSADKNFLRENYLIGPCGSSVLHLL